MAETIGRGGRTILEMIEGMIFRALESLKRM